MKGFILSDYIQCFSICCYAAVFVATFQYLLLRFSIGRYEAFPDNMTSEEIIAQAKAAAKEAADMLTLREPRTKVIGTLVVHYRQT